MKMFRKRLVNKQAYFFAQLFFVILCISGFTWQVVNISIAYFKYGAVSTIHISMPGMVAPRAINVCIPAYQIFNMKNFLEVSKYRNMTPVWGNWGPNLDPLTIKDRFRVTINANQFFKSVPNGMSKNVVSRLICFRFNSEGINDRRLRKIGFSPIDESARIQIHPDIEDSLEFFWVVVSPLLRMPWSEFLTAPILSGDRKVIRLSTMSVNVTKIQWPYVDDCYDYGSINYLDRSDAIRECINDQTVRKLGKNSDVLFFEMGRKDPRQDLPIVSRRDKSFTYTRVCAKKFYRSDCHLESLFTKSQTLGIKSNVTRFRFEIEKEPSLSVQSQPKLEFVEFVTYIFGAIGIWLGLSFRSINPVTVLLEIKTNRISTISQNRHNFKLDITQLETKFENSFNELSRRFDSKYNEQNRSNQEMRQMLLEIKNRR